MNNLISTNKTRWKIWLVLSLAYLITMFHRVSPAVIVDKLFASFHFEAASAVGSLAAIYFYIYFIMQIPAGLLVDVWGPRKVVISGLLLGAAGSIYFGLARTVMELSIGRFLVGLGVSVIFISAIRLYSTWFKPKEFATVMGATTFVGNLGTILATTPLAIMVNAVSWRSAFIFVGLITLVIVVLAYIFVHNEPAALTPKNRLVANNAAGTTSSLSELLPIVGSIIKDRNLWLALVVSFSIYGPLMALAGVWGVPYLMQVYHLERSAAASFSIMVPLGIMFGSLSIGIISDRLGSRKKPYWAAALGNALIWAVLAWCNSGAPPLKSLYLLYFLLGFFGNSVILSAIMVKEYNPPFAAGVASGIGNMGGFIGSAFMQPFFGFLMDKKWDGLIIKGVKFYPIESYQYAFAACFLFGCLAVMAATLLKESFKES